MLPTEYAVQSYICVHTWILWFLMLLVLLLSCYRVCIFTLRYWAEKKNVLFISIGFFLLTTQVVVAPPFARRAFGAGSTSLVWVLTYNVTPKVQVKIKNLH